METPAIPDYGAAIFAAADEPWSAQVSGEDPRFFQSLSVVRGMSFRDYVHDLLATADLTGKARDVAVLVGRISDARMRASEIEQQNLEEGLAELLKMIVPRQQHQMAMAERLGWNGARPRTLEDIGRQVGLTRERIRQIESRALKRLPTSHPTYLPVLDRVLKRLYEEAPIAEGDAVALTIKERCSNIGYHPDAIVAIAAALGREPNLRVSSVKGKRFVTTRGENLQVRTLSTTARKLAGANGAFSIVHAQRECIKSGADIDEEHVRSILGALPGFVPLDEERDWWRLSGLPEGRDRLEPVSKFMLR